MGPFNLSATLNILRTLKNPSLLCPHHTISTFSQLPVPLTEAFPGADIRAVVLDKDNCFAAPGATTVHGSCRETFARLRSAYPGDRLLIVSNSAGTGDDTGGGEADALEADTDVRVLRHATKKPGCRGEVFDALRRVGVTRADQIVVVGDRLFTDVVMAGMMGSYAVWVRDGVVPAGETFYGRIESGIAGMLERRGYKPLVPSSRDLWNSW